MTEARSVMRGGYIAFTAISIILLAAGIAQLTLTDGDINDARWYIIISICVAMASAMLFRFSKIPRESSTEAVKSPSKRASMIIYIFIAAIIFTGLGIALALRLI